MLRLRDCLITLYSFTVSKHFQNYIFVYIYYSIVNHALECLQLQMLFPEPQRIAYIIYSHIWARKVA